MLIMGCPTCPLYLQIGIGLSSSSNNIFKKSASFVAYLVLIKVKAFTPKSAGQVLNPFYIHSIEFIGYFAKIAFLLIYIRAFKPFTRAL